MNKDFGSGVYTLGSADPRFVFPSPAPQKKTFWQKVKSFFGKKPKLKSRPRGYRAFSGVDTKLFVEYQDGKVEVLPEVQAISISSNNLDPISRGEIIAILFDRSSLPKLQKVKNIALIATTEYGDRSASAFKGVEVTDYSFGISIDDIITEERILFDFKEFVPFKHWDSRFENEEDRLFWLWIDDVKSRIFSRKEK